MPLTIKELIRKNFISSSLMVIILMEIITVVSFVLLISTIESNASDLLSQSIEENISLNASANANFVSEKLFDVSNLTGLMQTQMEDFFTTIDQVPMPKIEGNYKFHENGAFYDANLDSVSALYYAKSTFEASDDALEKALKTERFNDDFQSSIESYPMIDQIYFNSWDSMTRIYPYIEDLPALLGPNMVIGDFNFYYLADTDHNPDKQVVWTDVYLDPAGMGWMMSCIAPIYNGEFLEGVFGADITIDHLITGLLDIHSNLNAPVLLINDQGLIIAMNEASESVLGIEELKNHIYDDVITETVLKSDAYNLFKIGDESFQENIYRIVQDVNVQSDIEISGENYFVAVNTIENTNWKLLVFANEAEVLLPVTKVKAITRNVFGLIVILLVILNIVLLRLITDRSEKLSLLVANPLNELKVRIQNLGQNKIEPSNFNNTNIEEIDVLNFEFYMMSQTLEERTGKLIQTEIEKKEQSRKMASYLKDALTDKLTGLTNRRGIEDYLDDLFSSEPLADHETALIIFDIDHFKSVNDNYGHLVGDEVLVDISKLLLELASDQVHVARWGGEEFMMVLEKTSIEGAIILAETMRTTIERHQFSIDKPITASFGVSVITSQVKNKRALIQHADQALYDAKSSGRNCVKYFS